MREGEGGERGGGRGALSNNKTKFALCITSEMTSASAGLQCLSHLLGVIPLVLF